MNRKYNKLINDLHEEKKKNAWLNKPTTNKGINILKAQNETLLKKVTELISANKNLAKNVNKVTREKLIIEKNYREKTNQNINRDIR